MGGERLSLYYEDCLRKGKIRPFSRGKSLARREIESAASDLERAQKTFSEGDYKWATIQVYYSMFHSARALLYSRNLREHSHFCLVAAIRALFVETHQLSNSMLDGLKEAKSLREDADYYGRWSKKGCQGLLKTAHGFLEQARKLVAQTN
ncbi:MAG: HEPN domain-containing protein [Candidatus Aminicenantes bacterium]|nr:HEPN domain-containing protein [Candidatus Aminicenantes bacterium]MDH5743066.1 HEPN domain-containing protein [Candidatus Aminicenantes bacterium]